MRGCGLIAVAGWPSIKATPSSMVSSAAQRYIAFDPALILSQVARCRHSVSCPARADNPGARLGDKRQPNQDAGMLGGRGSDGPVSQGQLEMPRDEIRIVLGRRLNDFLPVDETGDPRRILAQQR